MACVIWFLPLLLLLLYCIGRYNKNVLRKSRNLYVDAKNVKVFHTFRVSLLDNERKRVKGYGDIHISAMLLFFPFFLTMRKYGILLNVTFPS